MMSTAAAAASKPKMGADSSPLKVEAAMGAGGEDLAGEREEREGEGWKSSRSRAAQLGVRVPVPGVEVAAAAATAGVTKGGQEWKRGPREREERGRGRRVEVWARGVGGPDATRGWQMRT
jgi:hypothetical protein